MAAGRSIKVLVVPTSRETPEKNANFFCDSRPCVEMGKLLKGTSKNLNYKAVREKLCDGCGTPLCWC